VAGPTHHDRRADAGHADNVTVHGLFNEHFQHYQILWTGERGRTDIYQSEIRYDPPSVEQWNDNGQPGFASYKVVDLVQTHQAWGLGIYNFSLEEAAASGVHLENSIEVPDNPGIEMTRIVNFAGLNGDINHVVNGLGPDRPPTWTNSRFSTAIRLLSPIDTWPISRCRNDCAA